MHHVGEDTTSPLEFDHNELCVTCLVLLFTTVFETNSWRCDYSYVKQAHGYFKYHSIPATWADARFRCQSEGAVLASPYPDDIQNVLLDMMRDFNLTRLIFTGIHATFSKGDYYTIEGTPLNKIPIKWMANEPNNSNNEELCLILTSEGLSADKKCGDQYTYFCYRRKNDDKDMFTDSCGTSDRAYEYSKVTHSCYKFHTVPRTWFRAYMTCSAEGGYLAVINSHEEAKVLRELYAKFPDVKIIGNTLKQIALIGFHDWNEHGDWRTIHGQTLSEAGYDKFAPNQPDTFTTGEHCGSIFRTGLLNDAPCGIPYAFICEKKPNSLICEQEIY